MGKLDNRIALVTGAAEGLGAAIAGELAAAGATVVITDINEEGLRSRAELIGSGVVPMLLDARDENAWKSVIDQIARRFGRLDILVNNAGGAGGGTIEDTALDFYRNTMALNVDSVFIGSKLAIELLKKSAGNIVNISSVHGIRAAGHATAYTAAKGAVTMLTKAIALHCAQQGYRIRCNSVHPGYILTTQTRKWIEEQPNAEELLHALGHVHPIGFMGDPVDVAKGVLYLASDDARFVTGSELVIDGGFCL